MGMRGLALLARFSLAIYIAKYLSLDSVGAFGGGIAILPAVLGFGLNYRISRELVGLPIEIAALRIRDHLLVTAVTFVVASFGAVIAIWGGLIKVVPDLGLVIFIGLLEAMANNIHYSLISLRKPLFANLLIFIRTASWVFPFIGLGLLFPALRNFHALLVFWLLALVATFLTLIVGLRDWPWQKVLTTAFDRTWITSHLRQGGMIWASDLSIVGASYIDRFIINFQLGLEETGIFIFYWALANGVQLLVDTGVIQVALPYLMDSAHSSDSSAFGRAMRFESLKVFAVAVAIAAMIYGAAIVLVPYLGRSQLSSHPWLLPTMLVAVIIRLQSSVANYGLYVRGKDRTFSLIAMLAVIVSTSLTLVALPILGVGGIGFAMIAIELLLLACRLFNLRHDILEGSHYHPAAVG